MKVIVKKEEYEYVNQVSNQYKIGKLDQSVNGQGFNISFQIVDKRVCEGSQGQGQVDL